MLRPLGGDHYKVLGHTGNQTDPCDGQPHSYLPTTPIPVQAGDVLGVYVVDAWWGVLGGGSVQVGEQSEPAVGDTISVPSSSSLFGLDASATLVTDSDLALTGVPSDQIVNATSPTGAVVNYTTPTATDEDLSTVTVGCAPASGSTFAIGDTTVTCTATDTDGDANSPARRSFNITVLGAPDQLVALCRASQGVGPGKSLAHKCAAAQAAFAAGDPRETESILNAYINEVRAQRGKKIPAATADSLIAAAQQIVAVIGPQDKPNIHTEQRSGGASFSPHLTFLLGTRPHMPVATD